MNFRESVTKTVKDAFCEFSANTRPFALWLFDKTRFIQPGSSSSFWDDQRNSRGLAGLICDRPPVDDFPPATTPSFPGGQCEGVAYIIRNTYIRTTADGQDQPPRTDDATILPGRNSEIFGPIEGPLYVPTNAGQIAIRYRAFDKNGVIGTFPAGGGPAISIRHERWEYERKDGLPDDCGNAPGTPAPPYEGDEHERPVTINFENNEGGDVTIEGTTIFGFPIINVKGDLTVPFTIESLELGLQGDFNLSTGDISFNFGGNSDNEKCCLPPGPEEDIPGEEEEEERNIMIGVVVTTDVVTTEYQYSIYDESPGPDLYYPRLGNVYFRVQIEGSGMWTAGIAVKNRRQYIQCPVEFGAVKVVGHPVAGVEWTLTPIYRTIPLNEYPT